MAELRGDREWQSLGETGNLTRLILPSDWGFGEGGSLFRPMLGPSVGVLWYRKLFPPFRRRCFFVIPMRNWLSGQLQHEAARGWPKPLAECFYVSSHIKIQCALSRKHLVRFNQGVPILRSEHFLHTLRTRTRTNTIPYGTEASAVG